MREIIGIGCDIVAVSRIERVFSNPSSWPSVFTAHEIAYFSRLQYPLATIAGHFAAKEAVVKAIGTGFRKGIGFHDIEITHDSQGKPEVTASPNLVHLQPGIEFMVSISHEREYAIAYATALHRASS